MLLVKLQVLLFRSRWRCRLGRWWRAALVLEDRGQRCYCRGRGSCCRYADEESAAREVAQTDLGKQFLQRGRNGRGSGLFAHTSFFFLRPMCAFDLLRCDITSVNVPMSGDEKARPR